MGWLRVLMLWLRGPEWTAAVDVNAGTVHKLPRDTVAHERSEDCICGPAVTMNDPDEAIRWEYRHHRLGGA